MAPPLPAPEMSDEAPHDARPASKSLRKMASRASTMDEDDAVMKEEDAAILERGVRDSCSTGETPPVFSPIPTASPPKDFSMLPPTAENGSSSNRTLRLSGDEVSRESVDAKASPAMQNADLVDSEAIEPAIQGASIPANQKESPLKTDRSRYFRRCLSGDVRPSSEILEPETDRQEGGKTISPVSVTSQVRPIAASAPPSAVPDEERDVSQGLQSRSASYHRRLNEACQFAEAVGELPPTKVTDVQVIIEEDESDDDDDSDDELIVDDETVLSGHSVDSTGPLSLHDSLGLEVDGSDAMLTPAAPSPSTLRRPKVRPQWPFQNRSSHSTAYLHKLPEEVNTQDYVYKGIVSNPPEITKRGISRGNYAQLHRKAWLEVSDKYHRYGKNLRLYYKYWERLGYPTNQFFDWLDSKGEAAGQPLPNLPECPRSQLDSDTVLYITNPEVLQTYALEIVPDETGRGLILDVDGDPVRTGPEGWIFCLRDSTLYGAQKIASVSGHSKERFHHSSFFGGKAVAAAGILITDDDGYLTRWYPHSGHYRPGEADMQRMLFFLHHHGVNLRSFEMDTQQMFHVTRHDPPDKNATDGESKKKKKIESLHLTPALFVAYFLAHKARMISKGVFDQIHQIRNSNVTSASEALNVVDGGGIWK